MLKIRSMGQAVQKLSSEKENKTFGCCDLDPMTFTSELGLDMVMTTFMLKIRSIGQAVQKLSLGYTDREIDRQTG